MAQTSLCRTPKSRSRQLSKDRRAGHPDKVSIPMEVDTGASVAITSTIRLQTYAITVVGSTDVQVVYRGQTATLPLVIVKGDGPTLSGRNWLTKIRLNWEEIHYTST